MSFKVETPNENPFISAVETTKEKSGVRPALGIKRSGCESALSCPVSPWPNCTSLIPNPGLTPVRLTATTPGCEQLRRIWAWNRRCGPAAGRESANN